ncbi:FecCD family ABC transporter permease [Phycisphaerales bacterium AB-hyl4]|uniref:FecCD family ABC transporter permease n=1 Tax=Natronomicrosphaera hydrolytica TaxID=3242702 RepID=A0ABV4UAB5_9BACT
MSQGLLPNNTNHAPHDHRLVTRLAARRRAIILITLLTALAAVALFRLAVGWSSLGLPAGEDAALIWQIRLYRVAIAATVGAALAVAGVALQTLLRNPLAEPYILGLSTGAAAGVMAQSLLFYYMGIALGASHLGALVGATASMLIVFLASRRHGVLDPLGLLLTGVVLGTINGAIIMLLNYLAGPGGIRDDLMRWMMGYLNESTGGLSLAIVAVVTLVGIASLLAMHRAMDVATLSESEARSLGVPLPGLRTLLFLTASVLAAGAVVLAGPIAFVGLICPHLGRILLGPRHGPLIIASAILGATLIIAADVAAALIALVGPGIGLMPIGIFTAIIGGPVFLWMLRPHLGRGVE